MVVLSNLSPIRDLSPWKKILDDADDSSIIGFFVSDISGKIVLFNKNLPRIAGISSGNALRMSTEEIWQSLRKNGQPSQAVSSPLSDDFFGRREIRKIDGENRSIVWWGFPLGFLPHPSGIYFFYRSDSPDSKNPLQTATDHLIQKKLKKVEIASLRILMDCSDKDSLSSGIRQLMEWEEPLLRSNRVILLNGPELSEESSPVYLRYECPNDEIRMEHDQPLYGTRIFFKRLVEYGPRPAMVIHTERNWIYEILFPLTWHIHIMGWVGVPMPNLAWWIKYDRLNFEEMIRGLGYELGEVRASLGFFPRYGIQDGIFGEESFMELVDCMINRRTPRQFVLLLFRMTPIERVSSFQKFLAGMMRGMDALCRTPEGLLLFFPDQDDSRQIAIENRYRSLAETFCSKNPDAECFMTSIHFSSKSDASSKEELLHRLIESPRIAVSAGDQGVPLAEESPELQDLPEAISYK